MYRNARNINVIARRAYSQAKNVGGSSSKASSGAKAAATATSSADVALSKATGLTTNCVKATTGPVGPGAAANAAYKVPEYFCFNRFSYAEAEVEMAKYRCPQPSAVKK